MSRGNMLTIKNGDKIIAMEEFQGWLQEQLDLHNWTASDLAERAGVGPSTITRILTGERKAGPDVCTKIAQALSEDPDKVFRLAGILPEKGSNEASGRNEFEEELLYWNRQLPEDQQEFILETVKGLAVRHAAKKR
jgi:transcriptional regulator with XRE-family HTH domain